MGSEKNNRSEAPTTQQALAIGLSKKLGGSASLPGSLDELSEKLDSIDQVLNIFDGAEDISSHQKKWMEIFEASFCNSKEKLTITRYLQDVSKLPFVLDKTIQAANCRKRLDHLQERVTYSHAMFTLNLQGDHREYLYGEPSKANSLFNTAFSLQEAAVHRIRSKGKDNSEEKTQSFQTRMNQLKYAFTLFQFERELFDGTQPVTWTSSDRPFPSKGTFEEKLAVVTECTSGSQALRYLEQNASANRGRDILLSTAFGLAAFSLWKERENDPSLSQAALFLAEECERCMPKEMKRLEVDRKMVDLITTLRKETPHRHRRSPSAPPELASFVAKVDESRANNPDEQHLGNDLRC